MLTICAKCHAENRPGARHCLECGVALEGVARPAASCPDGFHVLGPDAARCVVCGAVVNALQSGGLDAPLPRRTPFSPPHPEIPPERRPPRPRTKTLPPERVYPPGGWDAPERSDRTATPAVAAPVERPQCASPFPPAQPGVRRIVGLLVTYTWKAEGEVFPVLEGRNYVGSAPDCEVCVRADPQLSSRHAAIIFHGRNFQIDDEKSLNGTFVDGELVEGKRRLKSHSTVRTGATLWTFLSVKREE